MDGSFGVPLDRPARLPKIHRLKSSDDHVEKIRDSIRNRQSKKSFAKPEKVQPHLQRDAAEKFIVEKLDAAFHGDYDSKCDFLNRLNALIIHTLPDSLNSPEFFEKMCSTVLKFLKDDHPAIRAMGFRLIRLCLFTERNLSFLLVTTHVDIYVVRSLDLWVENEMERGEALQLIAAMILVYEASNLKKLIESTSKSTKNYAFPKSVMQPVIAIALKAINTPRSKDNSAQPEQSADNERDRLATPCMSLFFELCIYEPELILEMAGTDWMVRILTGAAAVTRRIVAIVGRILVAWLDDPKVRLRGQLHLVLEQIFAPLVEFGFFQRSSNNMETCDRMVEYVMENFSYSFLCILRSWSGLFACAAVGPNSSVIASSPLRLLEYLGLGTVGNANLSRIRDMIVDICCDFMDLPYASKSFQTWNEAVDYYGSMASPDTFNSSLKDDFVVAQSEMLVNNDIEFSKHVDLLTSFRALAFFILINAGLPQSLSRLIVAQPDAPSAIKATLLMSDMLRTAPSIVPTSWRAAVLSMPTLVQSACEALSQSKAAAATHGYYDEDTPDQYTFINAENAELVLHRFDMLNRVWIHNATVRPSADSNYALFLHPPQLWNDAPFRWRRSDETVNTLLEECILEDGTLNMKVTAMLFNHLLEDMQATKRMSTLEQILEIADKLLNLVLPKRGVQATWSSDRSLVVTAKNAILVLMELASDYPAVDEVLSYYVKDFKEALDVLTNPQNTGLFCMKNITFGGTMYHFALIGAYSTHSVGLSIMEKAGVFQVFIDMMNSTTNIEYVKLVVSCLDYGQQHGELANVILQKALTATSEPSRRWCTRFLSALAPLRLTSFEEWGMRMLLGQLGDTSVKVVRHAIRILHAWFPMYPSAVRYLRAVRLEAFGEAGVLLRAHYFSDETCCTGDEAAVRKEVIEWMENFNTRYFQSIDDDMRVALLSIRRSLNGSFSRSSGERLEKYGLRAPVHLFGSLAGHHFGRWILSEERVCRKLLARMLDDKDTNAVKGALMALAQIGAAEGGFTLLPPDAVPLMVELAEESPVLSVRGAAFWALNILGSSQHGAQSLAELGWESNRHRSVVDKVRSESQRIDGISELRKGTVTPIFHEVSTSGDRSVRTESPLSIQIVRKNRDRSSSEVVPSHVARVRDGDSPNRLPIRRSHSDVGLSTVCERRNTEKSESDDGPARLERTLTGESAVTSGLGSLADESMTAAGRRRATTGGSALEEWDTRTRSSTIAHCLSNGLTVDKSRLEAEGQVADMMREPHFSSRSRKKWGLAPLRVRRFLQVNRNVGDPVRYVYMSREEEESLSEYRRLLLRDGWLWSQLQNESTSGSEAHSMHAVHTIALPAEVDIMCMNIFAPRSRDWMINSSSTTESDEMVQRGAKSGHGRSQRIEPKQAHRPHNCFYCSAKRPRYVLPKDVDVPALRREVLHEVDMLEIIESAPERKLLSLRNSHSWLFEWPCLYADVLELLDEYRFRAKSRAFLQTIFYDALKL